MRSVLRGYIDGHVLSAGYSQKSIGTHFVGLETEKNRNRNKKKIITGIRYRNKKKRFSVSSPANFYGIQLGFSHTKIRYPSTVIVTNYYRMVTAGNIKIQCTIDEHSTCIPRLYFLTSSSLTKTTSNLLQITCQLQAMTESSKISVWVI